MQCCADGKHRVCQRRGAASPCVALPVCCAADFPLQAKRKYEDAIRANQQLQQENQELQDKYTQKSQWVFGCVHLRYSVAYSHGVHAGCL